MIAAILIILTCTIAYYLLKLNYQYWEKRGVPGPKPSLLVGNLGKVFLFKEHVGHVYTRFYNEYQNEDIVGLYRATNPILLIRNPELIKEVTVKSFSHFRDNDIEVDKKHDPLFGRNPFALKGDEWKMVRGQLTPAFTTGKMKWLFPLLEENCLKLIKFIENEPTTTNGKGCDAKELSMRFTLENVGSCALGLDGRCLQEDNSPFRQLGSQVFAAGSWDAFMFFLMMVYPPLCKYLPLRIVTKVAEKKLFAMVTQTLKHREDNDIVRNDFLQIMSQLRKTSEDISDLDITAHATGFFFDGYETSSAVMSFALFELAANPEAQTKLREEMKSCVEGRTQLSYEELQSLDYLEAAVHESIRLHPVLLVLQKQCTRDFTFNPKDGHKPVTIEKGTAIILPVYGLHTDPQYYDDPLSYKPERFLESNRDNLTKYTFLPFGEGPRACLGQRFGMLQVKAGIAYIVQNYELSINKKTKLPLEYLVTNAINFPVGGLWLDFKKLQ